MPTDAALVVPTADVQPAPECEPEYVSERVYSSTPSIDVADIRAERDLVLSPEENAARTRALFAATQALSGDPSKMIITKAEEYADMGVTIGTILAGVLAFALTGLGAVLLLGQEAPALAESIGLSYERFSLLFENLPMWLSAIGAAMCYFILYVLAKRSMRHDLKRQRARDLARMRVAD